MEVVSFQDLKYFTSGSSWLDCFTKSAMIFMGISLYVISFFFLTTFNMLLCWILIFTCLSVDLFWLMLVSVLYALSVCQILFLCLRSFLLLLLQKFFMSFAVTHFSLTLMSLMVFIFASSCSCWIIISWSLVIFKRSFLSWLLVAMSSRSQSLSSASLKWFCQLSLEFLIFWISVWIRFVYFNSFLYSFYVSIICPLFS